MEKQINMDLDIPSMGGEGPKESGQPSVEGNVPEGQGVPEQGAANEATPEQVDVREPAKEPVTEDSGPVTEGEVAESAAGEAKVEYVEKVPELLADFYKDGKFDEDIEEFLKFRRAGSSDEYFRLKGLDYDKLSDSENLKEFWIRENLTKFEGDRKIAELEYKQELARNYPTLRKLERLKAQGADDDEIADFREEHSEDLADEEALLESRQQIARNRNKTWKEQQIRSLREQAQGPSEEQLKAVHQQHLKDVEEAVGGYQGFEVDGYKVAVDDRTAHNVKQTISNPEAFFKHVSDRYGVDLQTGQVTDYGKLAEQVHRDMAGNAWLEHYDKHVLQKHNLQTIEAQRENPNSMKPANQTGGPLDAELEMINAFKALRKR